MYFAFGCSVQEIFRDSLRSPELKLRVIKHQHHSGTTRPVNGVTKKQPPPPVYPKPSVNHPKHPMHNKENIAMVETEEKSKLSETIIGILMLVLSSSAEYKLVLPGKNPPLQIWWWSWNCTVILCGIFEMQHTIQYQNSWSN